MNRNRCLWFFYGLIAGATAGLLSSPRSGPRNRALITAKTKRAAANVRDTVTGTLDRGKDVVNRARETVLTAVDAGRKVFTA